MFWAISISCCHPAFTDMGVMILVGTGHKSVNYRRNDSNPLSETSYFARTCYIKVKSLDEITNSHADRDA